MRRLGARHERRGAAKSLSCPHQIIEREALASEKQQAVVLQFHREAGPGSCGDQRGDGISMSASFAKHVPKSEIRLRQRGIERQNLAQVSLCRAQLVLGRTWKVR